MFYRLRRKDGSTDRHSAGVLVNDDGSTSRLQHDSVVIKEVRYWQSPGSDGIYPSKWQLILPEQGLKLTVEPLLNDQELNFSFKYWEGAVAVDGTDRGQPIEGRGYVELTGYAQSGGDAG